MSDGGVSEAVAAIRAGHSVILPTDTVYACPSCAVAPA